jgi:hypothetical protein
MADKHALALNRVPNLQDVGKFQFHKIIGDEVTNSRAAISLNRYP